MTYEALVVPSESAPSVREIKRALITYDRVVLVDPGDRDVIPPTALMSAIGMPPILGINTGPVRPMGKVPGYDSEFERVFDLLKVARNEGLVEVQSSFDRTKTQDMTIGAVQTGGYPLNTRFLFWLYRSMASNQGFLKDAINNDLQFVLQTIAESEGLVLDGRGDGGINDIAPLPLLEFEKIPEDACLSLTKVARSRIASFIKYIGYCETKDLIPVLNNGCYGALAQRLVRNASGVLGEGGDATWIRRNNVLRLCHEEFMIDERLDGVSLKKLLKLRTRAWGAQTKGREKLFDSVLQIAQDAEAGGDFEASVQPLIANYREVSEDLVRERGNFNFSIKCDIAKAMFAGGTALPALLAQLGTPVASVGLLLAAGGIWVFDQAQHYQPQLAELKKKETTLRRSAGLGLHGFYSRIPNG